MTPLSLVCRRPTSVLLFVCGIGCRRSRRSSPIELILLICLDGQRQVGCELIDLELEDADFLLELGVSGAEGVGLGFEGVVLGLDTLSHALDLYCLMDAVPLVRLDSGLKLGEVRLFAFAEGALRGPILRFSFSLSFVLVAFLNRFPTRLCARWQYPFLASLGERARRVHACIILRW